MEALARRMLEAGTGIEGQVRSGSRARQADALHIAFGPYAEVIREFSLRTLITNRAGKKTHSNPFGVKPSCSIEEDDHEPQNDLIFLSAFMVGTTLSAAPLAAQQPSCP